jgi:hypothetical protein
MIAPGLDVGTRTMSPDALQFLFASPIGFSVAGLTASGYRLATRKLPSFRLLQRGPRLSTFATVPLLVLAAPFIILRNAVLSYRSGGAGLDVAMVGTVISGLWSLLSGWGAIMVIATMQST